MSTVSHEYLKIFGNVPFPTVKRWKKQFAEIVRRFEKQHADPITRFMQIDSYIWWKMYVFELNETVRSLVDEMMADVALVPFFSSSPPLE